MKILHTVESYLPAAHGMSEVVRQISEHLVKLGHEVWVATRKDMDRSSLVINGVRIKEFEISGSLVNGINGDASAYQNYLLNEGFDVITNFAAQQWATDLCFPILDQLKCVKIFVPTGFSGLNSAEFSEYFEEMPEWLKKYSNIVFLSRDYQDYEFAINHGIQQSKCSIIPNGANESEFSLRSDFSIRRHLNIPERKKIVLHVGSYTGIKGHDEAYELLLQSNRKDWVLIFVGKNFEGPEIQNLRRRTDPRSWMLETRNPVRLLWRILKWMRSYPYNKRVHFVQLTREQLIASFHDADIFLLPSQLECSPVVLFEAMASKTPFLSSEVGNVEELASISQSGKVLPTTKDNRGYSHINIEESCRILDDLLNERKMRLEMAQSGYQIWKKRFTWEAISREYEKLYQMDF